MNEDAKSTRHIADILVASRSELPDGARTPIISSTSRLHTQILQFHYTTISNNNNKVGVDCEVCAGFFVTHEPLK